MALKVPQIRADASLERRIGARTEALYSHECAAADAEIRRRAEHRRGPLHHVPRQADRHQCGLCARHAAGHCQRDHAERAATTRHLDRRRRADEIERVPINQIQ
jgi:hypothetical protein